MFRFFFYYKPNFNENINFKGKRIAKNSIKKNIKIKNKHKFKQNAISSER